MYVSENGDLAKRNWSQTTHLDILLGIIISSRIC